MRCQACGTEMQETYRSSEKGRTYIWYACRFVSCQQELLHVMAGEAAACSEQTADAAGGCRG
jgi:hypothetical protein